ncbi:MAG: MBL fold metallo-hydrolase [Clostridia bacterium]|nr:MBL fold metallo-hydrolase [Clostridia bacterium]
MRKIISWLMAAMLSLFPLVGGQIAQADELSLLAFHVGKADSLLLRSGDSTYLIDTARAKHWDFLEENLKSLGVTKLDGVLITHMDSDHVGGLKKLLKSDIEIEHIYVPAFFFPESGESKENPAIKAATKQKREVEYLQGGDEISLSGGSIQVLGPIAPATDKEDNNSLVLFVQAAGGSMLLAGDMEFPEEQTLLQAGVVPQADILKVANHGDDDATSEAFLSQVQPKIAIISTSTEEKTSTPAPRTLKALQKWQAEIYQTQETEIGILVSIIDGEISVEMLFE